VAVPLSLNAPLRLEKRRRSERSRSGRSGSAPPLHPSPKLATEQKRPDGCGSVRADADDEDVAEEDSAPIVSAIQLYPQNPAGGIDALQPLAQGSNRRAQAMLAWMLGQQSRVPEAAPLIVSLLDSGSGVAYLPMWIGQQLIGQGDPTLRQQGVRMLRYAVHDPIAFDPFGHVQQLVQQGQTDEAITLLDSAIAPRPSPEREHWQDLIAQAQSEVGEIQASAQSAQAERNKALAAIADARETVERGRSDLQRLVEEVGGLAGVAGATVQADDYGKRANVIEKRANRLTIAAVVLAGLIAVVALVLAIVAAGAKDPLEAVLEKAPISVPLLVLNVYIARLASGYRQEAVQLRHIELQIRAANPFLGALDEERRKAVLAMLALRFFPGQPLPVPSHTSEPPDVAEALGTLLAASEQAGRLRQPVASSAEVPAQSPAP
jgi:hypothetical protein